MKTIYIVLALLLIASRVGVAADSGLETSLNHQYKDRIYTLRQPMTAPVQQYDAQGNSPTASALGPWTIYGRVQIKHIKVEPARVVVEGQLVGMRFDPRVKTLVPVNSKDKVRLEISIDPPLDSKEQFHTILGHIFAFTKEDFLASVPDLWRKYLAESIDAYEDDGGRILFRPATPVAKSQDPNANLPPGVFHVGKEVTAPKALYAPDPDYSDAARREQFGGTHLFNVIVGTDGAVSHIELVRPLGLGLDENSEQKIKTWKFQPAKRNGEPVSVQVSVEVSFAIGDSVK